MSKVDLCMKTFSNPLVIGKLLAVIRRDGAGQILQRGKQLDHSICNSFCRLALDFLHESHARFTLRERNNGSTAALANDRVHFPITQALASIYDRRPLVDTHPVFELSTPIVAPVALPALLLAS